MVKPEAPIIAYYDSTVSYIFYYFNTFFTPGAILYIRPWKESIPVEAINAGRSMQ